jgi:hypothetical protein
MLVGSYESDTYLDEEADVEEGLPRACVPDDLALLSLYACVAIEGKCEGCEEEVSCNAEVYEEIP